MPNVFTEKVVWLDGRRVARWDGPAEFEQLARTTSFDLAVPAGRSVRAARVVELPPCPPRVRSRGASPNHYGLVAGAMLPTLAAWLEDSRLANGVAPDPEPVPEPIRPFVALAWQHPELSFWACTVDRGGPLDHCYTCQRRGEVVEIRLYRAGKDLTWVAPGPALDTQYFIEID